MKTTKETTCPCCGKGALRTLKREFVANIGEGQKLRIPDIEMEVCHKCGQEILSLESARQVDAAIAVHTERLTTKDLRAIREQFGVDQTEMSEAFGLGAKTFHRWEKGSQYPSRSMGYYLRLLREFPESFEWLRSRRWTRSNGKKGRPVATFPRSKVSH
jgi:putative zinc finger/helix-turn-helix YgiT family protein